MRAAVEFERLPKSFWASVRTLSQKVGYTERGAGQIKVPTLDAMVAAFESLGLNALALRSAKGDPTVLGTNLVGYFAHRAAVLNTYVEPRLMDVDRAKEVFLDLKGKLRPRRAFSMNKQKGDKRSEAYLTSMVNMLVEANAEGLPCDYDPRQLTTVTLNGVPLRTLGRRVDGAFPSAVNPLAIWEIKEYYYTTTFGSRVADGVYESLLDGMELEELKEHEGIKIQHYLMIDSHFTWWECGRSYLCRLIDMLHMGYVDEILFGYEVVERLPALVKELVAKAKSQ